MASPSRDVTELRTHYTDLEKVKDQVAYTVQLTIDGRKVEAPAGTSILDAARIIGVYIPALCHHPDLPPAKGGLGAAAVYRSGQRIRNAKPGERATGCGLCLVEIQGEPDLVASCSTPVRPGLVIVTDNERIRAKRQENLIPILARHPHACLTCAQREGCSRTQCTLNVPQDERCCTRFGRCELQAVAEYVGISPQTPRWTPTHLPIPGDDPLFTRDWNLCIGCTRCVRACRDLRAVEAIGFVYDDKGQVQVGSLGATLSDSGCLYCLACVEVCPTGALSDKSVRPGKKAETRVPCREACPVQMDVPAYLRLIAEGRREEANAVVREKVPFPGVLGRVCTRPCEEACRRGELNEPVSICALKRYASEGDRGSWKERGRWVAAVTGKNVAVVGAGPAGLTAAFYLRKAGHAVTVFEAREEAGGMMRYGIPRFRLPEEVLEREIQEILEMGVVFRLGQSLGRTFTLEGLRRDGFDAVFIATGAPLSRRMSLEGASPDVLWGVDLLGQVAEGKAPELKDRIIVVGGGNVAVDVARTALRCGARDVSVVCLERSEEMPADSRQVEAARAEGVRFVNSWGPLRVLRSGDSITGLELVHCSAVCDDRGRFKPQFDDLKDTIEGDQVVLAIGQASDLSFLAGHSDITVESGLVIVDPETLVTGEKGVYAGGDIASSQRTIVHAIAAGRKAASSIDKALGGSGIIEETLFERGEPCQALGRKQGFASWPREKGAEHPRHKGFQEVDPGLSEAQAKKEASRCLQCDLRLFVGGNPFPPQRRLALNAENVVGTAPEAEGVFRLYDGDCHVLAIKGTVNLRRDLLNAVEGDLDARWFDLEEDKMYTRRESELIQKYVQEHGKMPGGADEEDLF